MMPKALRAVQSRYHRPPGQSYLRNERDLEFKSNRRVVSNRPHRQTCCRLSWCKDFALMGCISWFSYRVWWLTYTVLWQAGLLSGVENSRPNLMELQSILAVLDLRNKSYTYITTGPAQHFVPFIDGDSCGGYLFISPYCQLRVSFSLPFTTLVGLAWKRYQEKTDGCIIRSI